MKWVNPLLQAGQATGTLLAGTKDTTTGMPLGGGPDKDGDVPMMFSPSSSNGTAGN